MVIQKRYINFDKYYKGKKIAPSAIANCHIACVKNHNIIDRESIRIVEVGKRYG